MTGYGAGHEHGGAGGTLDLAGMRRQGQVPVSSLEGGMGGWWEGGGRLSQALRRRSSRWCLVVVVEFEPWKEAGWGWGRGLMG